MNKKIVILFLLTVLFAFPLAGSAFRVTGGPSQPTQGAIAPAVLIDKIVDMVWWAFIAITVIFFVIIGILFLSNLGNPEKIAEARRALIWGGVGVAVGIFAFGILGVIINTLGF